MRNSKIAARTAATLFILAIALGQIQIAQAGTSPASRSTKSFSTENSPWAKMMENNRAALQAFANRMRSNAVPGQARKAPTKAGSARLNGMIARQASANGVPLALAHAVVRFESNYRPNARGSAGEIGLMQIKPATARGLGYTGSAKGLYDPETNLRYGMKYLGQAHRLGGGDICRTILKYNAGHGAKRMNSRSSAYCARVKRHMAGRAP